MPLLTLEDAILADPDGDGTSTAQTVRTPVPEELPGTVVVKDRHLPLDLLLWRAYGRPGNTSAILSAALRRNPGLAARGPEIPLLTRVVLPDPPTARPAARKVVDLFG